MYFIVFLQKLAIDIYTIPVRSAIAIWHCVEITWEPVVWDMLALLCETIFLALISTQTSASLSYLEVLKQQYTITYFNLSYEPHDIVLLMYTGNVIFCQFFCCTLCTLLKYTCYMWNRQGAQKSHRISSSPCSHIVFGPIPLIVPLSSVTHVCVPIQPVVPVLFHPCCVYGVIQPAVPSSLSSMLCVHVHVYHNCHVAGLQVWC